MPLVPLLYSDVSETIVCVMSFTYRWGKGTETEIPVFDISIVTGSALEVANGALRRFPGPKMGEGSAFDGSIF